MSGAKSDSLHCHVRRHTIEDRSSPVCMGVQRRIVSRDGHKGPWVCGKMTEVWKAYKRMRKANAKVEFSERSEASER